MSYFNNSPNLHMRRNTTSPEVDSITPLEPVMYIIYCHGETIYSWFEIPKYLGKIIQINYIADKGYVLSGGEENILKICDVDDDPRERKKSTDITNDMKLIGGPAIGVSLGIYICYLDEGLRKAGIIFDMTNNNPPPYTTTLKDMIQNIFIYHEKHFHKIDFKITMHTCRGYANIVNPGQSMNTYTVDYNLAEDFEKKTQLKDAMDISEGGKRSKTKINKKKQKRRKSKKQKRRKSKKQKS
jgi:hypothetical protein